LYLVVGGWNTLFTYVTFSLLYYLLNTSVYPSLILALSYIIASINGFIGFRYLVFKPVRHPLHEYLRYQVVYLPILAINMLVLPLALRYSSLNAYVIQALFAIFAVVTSYLGNKYFTFRRASRTVRPDEDQTTSATSDTEDDQAR
jgi:putative flippase GtrA